MILIAILAVASILSLAVFGGNEACEHSQGPDHASENAKEHASENSVLNRCVPQTCPPCTVGTPPNCVSIC